MKEIDLALTEGFQPIPGLLETLRIIGSAQMAQPIAGSVNGEEGEDSISHVATYVHRQTVEIGLEQVLQSIPGPAGEEVGLQSSTEGLAKRKQFAIHSVP